MNWFRRIWRMWFNPEPPLRLDGYVIQIRTNIACALHGGKWSAEEWHRQNKMRGEENLQRITDWNQGNPYCHRE